MNNQMCKLKCAK